MASTARVILLPEASTNGPMLFWDEVFWEDARAAITRFGADHSGLFDAESAPLSAVRPSDTDAYYDAVTMYRRGDPHPIIEEFTRDAFATVHHGRLLPDQVQALHDDGADNLRAREDAVAWRVLPLCSRADNALRQLQEAGAPSTPGLTARARMGMWSGRRRRYCQPSTSSLSAPAEI